MSTATATIKITRSDDLPGRYNVHVDGIHFGWVSKSLLDEKWSAHACTIDDLGRGERVIEGAPRRKDAIFELLLSVRRAGTVYVFDADYRSLQRPVDVARLADWALDEWINR